MSPGYRVSNELPWQATFHTCCHNLKVSMSYVPSLREGRLANTHAHFLQTLTHDPFPLLILLYILLLLRTHGHRLECAEPCGPCSKSALWPILGNSNTHSIGGKAFSHRPPDEWLSALLGRGNNRWYDHLFPEEGGLLSSFRFYGSMAAIQGWSLGLHIQDLVQCPLSYLPFNLGEGDGENQVLKPIAVLTTTTYKLTGQPGTLQSLSFLMLWPLGKRSLGKLHDLLQVTCIYITNEYKTRSVWLHLCHLWLNFPGCCPLTVTFSRTKDLKPSLQGLPPSSITFWSSFTA
jgi:hypothetical protein